MNNETTIPEPLLDSRELDKIDQLTKEYEKYHEPGFIGAAMNNAGNSIKRVMPDGVKNTLAGMKQGLSEADFIQQALKLVARGFTEIETRATKLTVSKTTILKRVKGVNDSVGSFDQICLARGYEIEQALNLKNIEDILLTVIQGGLTGVLGFPGIPVNIVTSTFLYFRAVQNIAMHYGYDVKNDIGELEIASTITMRALSPNMESGTETLSAMIGKMMLMTKATALRQGLNKTYASMIDKGGIHLLYVQIRALANGAAKKALDKAGKAGLEKTVFSEMLEQLGKYFGKSAGKKLIPVVGGIVGATIDTTYMTRVLKYAKIVYHKRFLLEKEQRILYLNENPIRESL